jgi:hypothetical protein
MGLICIPINIAVQFYQLSLDVTYFIFGLIEPVGPTPNISDSIGSIFGCNV